MKQSRLKEGGKEMKISNEIESRNYIGEIRQRFALGKYAILTGRVIGKRPFRDILFFSFKRSKRGNATNIRQKYKWRRDIYDG